ncbi:DUF3540 domain-containing protein [Pseudomonas sp. HK3]|jgi:hypothetical protein
MNTHEIALALTRPQDINNDHIFGEVINTDQGIITIKLDNTDVVTAKKAFSCAFDPIVNDTVELTVRNHHSYYVLNILERTQASVAMLSAPFGIDIKSPSISMQSNSLGINNQTMSVNARQFNQKSDSVNLNSDTAQFSSRTVESNIDRMIQRIKDSFRIIERIEQVSAVDIIQNIKNAFIQRSRQVDITAKSDVKINGERIHMG